MSFKRALATVFLSLGAVLATLVVAMNLLADARNAVAAAENRRYQSYQLADELRQSSDDLTRMVRSYVATRDPAYQQNFRDILAIRSGTLAAPPGYGRAAWSWATFPPAPAGEARSLEQRMRDQNFADREFAVLLEAREESDRLAVLETEAMAAMDAARDQPDAGEKARAWASQRVYGEEYRAAKTAIMTRIDEFFALLEARTAAEVQHAREVESSYLALAWSLGALAVAVCVGSFIYLSQRVVKPVHALVDHAVKLAGGDYGQHVEVPACEEVSVLARTFNTMSTAIESDIQRRVRQERELQMAKAEVEDAYVKIKADLLAASKVQRSLLPDVMPDSPGLTFAFAYMPCDDLGGDTLNVLELDERHVALYLVDVSGHGVQAALLASTLSHVLTPVQHSNSVLWTRDPVSDTMRIAPPKLVAERLNTRFPFDPEINQFFTIHYGVLDTRTLRYRFVSCGHPRPVLVAAGKPPEVVAASGPAIGILPAPAFVEKELQLATGDRLYFFSDGVLEATNATDVEFRDGALLDRLAGIKQVALDAGLEWLLGEVKAWAGGIQLDDVSAMALEVHGDEAGPPPG